MPSLFDVDPDFVSKNMDKFTQIAPKMADKFLDYQDDDFAEKDVVDYISRDAGEMANLGMILSNNPAAFDEIRNKVKMYNALRSIGIYGAMPREYNAFNRLDRILQGKGDPGYKPWISPEVLKNTPRYQVLPNPNVPGDQHQNWINMFGKRRLQEI